VTSDLFYKNSRAHYQGLSKFIHRQKIEDAIAREKQLKKWNRHGRINLFSDFNPGWKD
jgi:predicted GIY-YIG superfamily endonuclease